MKSELEEAEDYANKFFTLPGDDWLLGAVGRAHLAGQKVGEKRGYLRALEEVEKQVEVLLFYTRLINTPEQFFKELKEFITKLKEGA